MPLHLHNSATRRIEPFTPLDPDHVGLYVCGPTVYDFAHIGNARSAVAFDVLVRLLRYLFPAVTYVRNVTDIDDKIIAAADRAGEPIEAITARFARHFDADMAALGCQRPDIAPRATDHVDEMIAMIETLIARGHAYEIEGHVLFHVPSWPDYGALSGRSREEMEAGARVEIAPYKRDPADFVLWKPSDPEKPGWDSPWGRGRPGWHIECSAMATRYLGRRFDIHGGGVDLTFPHHENEIAQSCACHPGSGFARYWVHNGILMVEGRKMSKSLGNYHTAHELLADHPGEAIRYGLISGQYRQPLDFSLEGLAEAKRSLDRFYSALNQARDLVPTDSETLPGAVLEALEDDLNTPRALAALHDSLHRLNSAATRPERARAKGELLASGAVLGLLTQDPGDWFRWRPAAAAALDEAEIERRIEERARARGERDFARADTIRDELAAQGILLEDRPDGTIWKTA